ncbi:NtaA/DmoA family FMN-dependent monooxygenase [Aquibium sp. ELW1220]|jgi:FMN-dependent oxidoreductase (nitrilotriacetate monooxygenase family)|uniref:NtaA/DmoA family FMN-dependent monooxygenase n=1 Tax=Aquibium sp. ELW1220 TaxID=2976766 RepID=UPI0025AEE6C0|nr:NtaA/DmoA family FMN-dependent monooxygenase [Aquibium sp. ELW1220]MDN2582910.1 NtaA/DmoA family FMN-dependent monooxygenase [Aquibium sp. ELW1220]
MCQSETMHLAVDCSFIHTDHLWAQPGSWVNYQYYGPDFYEDVARIAQRGFFDMIFFGDAAETPENFGGNYDVPLEQGIRWPKHDMVPMIPYMARVAPNLGFGTTMSTTYHHPFHVARLFSSLDHVTGGRVAWNAVTSAYKNEAANWGFDTMLPAAERYEKAREHMKVVRALWDSVEADAIVMDRETGVFADPSKVHLVNHSGKYFKVRGPLPCLPSPQGSPVVIQAGQSDDGMNLAAMHADMQFVSRRTLKSIADHRAVLDDLTVKHGRSPRDLGVFWSVRVQVGDTKEDAVRKEKRFLDSLPENAGIIELSFLYGIDFSKFDGKMKLRDLLDVVQQQQVHWGTFQELVKTEGAETTLEEVGRRYIADRSNYVVGSVKEVADHLEAVHESGGRNGGIILAKSFAAPGMLRDFAETVVPELQRRGLVRTKYAATTLRGNLNS